MCTSILGDGSAPIPPTMATRAINSVDRSNLWGWSPECCRLGQQLPFWHRPTWLALCGLGPVWAFQGAPTTTLLHWLLRVGEWKTQCEHPRSIWLKGLVMEAFVAANPSARKELQTRGLFVWLSSDQAMTC